MKTLRVGIASFAETKAWTLAVARGERKVTAQDPKLWFVSVESALKVLSTRNLALLDLIASHKPASLTELAALSGRAKSNLSRTLKTMENAGLIELVPHAGRLKPRVRYDVIRLDLKIGTQADESGRAAA
jgi:predicted transcriptional regulator